MAASTHAVRLRSKGKPIKNLPSQVAVSHDATISDVYHLLAKNLRCSIHRIRLARPAESQYLGTDSKDIVAPDAEFHVKDLGPQIGWRTVYMLEYIGPLLCHPIMYFLLAGTTESAPSLSQTLVCGMVMAHYMKRELETIFVHTFSSDTMPLKNLFKNTFHYWLLGGVNLAFWSYYRPCTSNNFVIAAGVALFLCGELWNLDVHLYLARSRQSGSRERIMPTGHGFSFVTCPNYLAETVAWTGVWFVTGFNWAGALFTIVSSIQMLLWARKRESRYRKQFPDSYKPMRWSMIPGLR